MDSTALLKRVDELPRLPKAVSELLDAVNDENTSVKGIATKVSHDPLISARVLRLANSAHFGRSREVGSIDEAVIRLGMQTLRTLVIASAVIGAIPKVEGVDLATFWGETFEVALYCQELAKRCGAAQDAAFTCGILHNIGDLLIAVISPEEASQIRDAIAAGGVKPEVEAEILGFTGAEVGAILAQNWKFTPELVQGIRFQNNAKKSEPFSKLAALLGMAHRLVTNWDQVAEDDKTSWLSQQATSSGLKMDMGGLTAKLTELRGQGFEIGQQLA